MREKESLWFKWQMVLLGFLIEHLGSLRTSILHLCHSRWSFWFVFMSVHADATYHGTTHTKYCSYLGISNLKLPRWALIPWQTHHVQTLLKLTTLATLCLGGLFQHCFNLSPSNPSRVIQKPMVDWVGYLSMLENCQCRFCVISLFWMVCCLSISTYIYIYTYTLYRDNHGMWHTYNVQFMLHFHIFEPTNPNVMSVFSAMGDLTGWKQNQIKVPPRWGRDVVFAPRKYELHVDVGNGIDPLSTLEQMSQKDLLVKCDGPYNIFIDRCGKRINEHAMLCLFYAFLFPFAPCKHSRKLWSWDLFGVSCCKSPSEAPEWSAFGQIVCRCAAILSEEEQHLDIYEFGVKKWPKSDQTRITFSCLIWFKLLR